MSEAAPEQHLNHDHHHHGETTNILRKDDATIRLKCVELAIECEAKRAFNGDEDTTLREEAQVIYEYVTQGYGGAVT